MERCNSMAEHFDLHDAARFLGLSYEAALQLVHAGDLPGHRLAHGGWTVPKEAVMEYLQKENHGK